jgi:hypothetical protein
LSLLPPFNVTPPAATFNVSQSGLLSDPTEALAVNPFPTVRITGPTTRSSLFPFKIRLAKL